jgi:alkylation response protein AidB-like acyl-CoA dehydrogenase
LWLWRLSRVQSIFGCTSEIMKTIIDREVTGLHA